MTEEIDLLKEISEKLSTLAKNYEGIRTGRVFFPLAGTAVQLTSLPIPDGAELVIKALPTNAGAINVGGSRSEAESTGYPLLRNEGISCKVRDRASIWVMADSAGDGIAWIVEKR